MIKISLLTKNILDNLHEGAYIIDMNKTVVYWNKSAEAITGYTSEEVIGKSCEDNVLVHVDEKGNSLCNSFCPIARIMEKDEVQEQQLFLYNKAGYRIPISVRIIPLKDEEGTIIGAVELFQKPLGNIFDTDKLNALIRYSFIDPVTELTNRRYAETKLNSMLQEAAISNTPFQVIVFEVQDLKAMNEKFGDAVVDSLLKLIGKTIHNNVSTHSMVSRWCSNRFMIILPEIKRGVFLILTDKLKALVDKTMINTKEGEVFLETVCVGLTIKHTGSIETITNRIEDLITKVKKDNLSIKIDEDLI